MKSRTFLSLLAVAAVISIPLSGCSSDDEPQSVVDTRIGLSAESVFVGNDMGDSEVISVQTDGWKLSYVTFSDSHNAYMCNSICRLRLLLPFKRNGCRSNMPIRH